MSINNSNSLTQKLTCGVPQGSILGPLLFLIYINDFNCAIKHASAYHFADDTNLLLISKSLKTLNKQINHDLANVVDWLRANKISLNTKKTELVLFKSKQRKITKKLNFRISGQKIFPVKSIKYLGVRIDENLSFQLHLDNLALKLSRANGMLAKIRYYINIETRLNVYHAIFGSHLRYGCPIWGQSRGITFSKIVSLQNKAMRIIYFQNNRFNSTILYFLSNILHIKDLIQQLNCAFVWDQQHSKLPLIFKEYFTTRVGFGHHTRSVTNNKGQSQKSCTVVPSVTQFLNL